MHFGYLRECYFLWKNIFQQNIERCNGLARNCCKQAITLITPVGTPTLMLTIRSMSVMAIFHQLSPGLSLLTGDARRVAGTYYCCCDEEASHGRSTVTPS